MNVIVEPTLHVQVQIQHVILVGRVEDVLAHRHVLPGSQRALLLMVTLTKVNAYVARWIPVGKVRPATSALQMEIVCAEVAIVHVIRPMHWICALAVFLLQLLYLETCLQHAR